MSRHLAFAISTALALALLLPAVAPVAASTNDYDCSTTTPTQVDANDVVAHVAVTFDCAWTPGDQMAWSILLLDGLDLPSAGRDVSSLTCDDTRCEDHVSYTAMPVASEGVHAFSGELRDWDTGAVLATWTGPSFTVTFTHSTFDCSVAAEYVSGLTTEGSVTHVVLRDCSASDGITAIAVYHADHLLYEGPVKAGIVAEVTEFFSAYDALEVQLTPAGRTVTFAAPGTRLPPYSAGGGTVPGTLATSPMTLKGSIDFFDLDSASTVRIIVTGPGGYSKTILDQALGDDGRVVFPATLLRYRGTYTIHIRRSASPNALDRADPIRGSITFKAAYGPVLDTTAPRIIHRTPASGATGVSRTPTVRVVFSEPVKGVSASTVRLIDLATGKVVAARVTYVSSSRTAVLVPRVRLAARHLYRVSVSSAVTDRTGNHLAGSSTRFTTRR